MIHHQLDECLFRIRFRSRHALRILYRKAPKSKRKFAKNWATRQDTDIILLKIGTNGYAQSDRTALQTLVNTITFTHPQGVLADDLAASYHWSKDMQTFHDDLTTDAAGNTVSFAIQANTPVPGITTVAAKVSSNSSERLFLRAKVTEN
jgi:hypothetical protein